MFLYYIRQANLEHLLDSTGPYTVFAPTDTALESFASGLASKLAKDPTVVWSFVTYHVTSGSIHMNDIKDGGSITSLTGQLSYLNTIAKDGEKLVR